MSNGSELISKVAACVPEAAARAADGDVLPATVTCSTCCRRLNVCAGTAGSKGGRQVRRPLLVVTLLSIIGVYLFRFCAVGQLFRVRDCLRPDCSQIVKWKDC